MKSITSTNIADTAAFAREFLAGLLPRTEEAPRLRSEQATIVGLYGDLGSGKTTFVQQVAKILGVRGSIQSPTFVIMKNYKITSPQPPFKGGVAAHSSLEGGARRAEDVSLSNLIHIDAYRLDGGADLQRIGWDALAEDPKNLIFIEWADRVSDILPPDHLKLRFEFINDTTRKIALE